MKTTLASTQPRLLVVDDNRAIHEDFRKIFGGGGDTAALDAAEASLFEETTTITQRPGYTIDSAYQGEEALAMVQAARAEGRPYAMAFVDVRMPPGWDGIETIARIWAVYPDLQVVVCTAYSDYSWDDMNRKLGHTDRLVILKKPFDNVEVLQLAAALTEKWRLLQEARAHVSSLEARVAERTQELQAVNRNLQNEIQERCQMEAWLAAEKEFLECLASNAALPAALELLARKIEALSAGLVCSILMLDREGTQLRHCAAPSLPPAYCQALDGLEIGPEVGSCGAAAYHRRLVVVSDIATDPRWKNFKELARAHDLHACWSSPVIGAAGQVLGTFAVYYREIREPSDAELNLIRRATNLVGLALNRHRAETERKSLEIQVHQGQKLESIGRLAAGVAHEINTPTQYIGDNTQFVRDSFVELLPVLNLPRQLLDAMRDNQVTTELLLATESTLQKADVAYLTEEIPKAVAQSLEGVERVAKIVRAMKEFSHPGTDEKTQVDLNHAIDSTLTVARNEWKYVAELVTDFDPTLPPVICLPGEFNQVILNLTVNAAHAIADTLKEGDTAKGTITVSTKRDGAWAEVRLRDSGTGIPESARAKIFDPFFTTKGVGKGTGQGLAIAHSVIVDKHGGKIWFETELGKGTVFIIRIPLTPAEPAAAPHPAEREVQS